MSPLADPAGPVEIRALTTDDWSVWRGLRLAALADAPEAFGSSLADWSGEGDREGRWRERLELPGSRNVVARIQRRHVGMASGVPVGDGGRDGTTNSPVIELISVWVDPTARGRGVAHAMFGDLERWARTLGACRLSLCVAEGNDLAVSAYERLGFRLTGEISGHMPDGRPEHAMTKPL